MAHRKNMPLADDRDRTTAPLGQALCVDLAWPPRPQKAGGCPRFFRRHFSWPITIAWILLVALTGLFLTPTYFPPASQQVKAAANRTLIEDIGAALQTYVTQVSADGTYPASDGSTDWLAGNLIVALRDNDLMNITDETLDNHPHDPSLHVFVDAWQTPLRYRTWRGVDGDRSAAHNPDGFDLWSAGPDGLFGPGDSDGDGIDDAEDNIGNWKRD